MSGWHFDYRPSAALPPLAWIAGVEPHRSRLTVDCGSAVRRADGAFFEGSWAGPSELSALPAATTVFGSGIVVAGERLAVVTPSHNLESIYSVARDGRLTVSNSLVGLLGAAGLALDPAVDYPALFGLTRDGIGHSPISLPTRGEPVQMTFFENVAIDADGGTELLAKPREAPFASFADYRERLRTALRSVIANGRPHEPVVALSSGYDSTAIAALAAPLGCRRAIGFHSAKDFTAAGAEAEDSGAESARRLGLEMVMRERLAYRARDDLPEAEFLATGMSGEEVVFSAFESELRGTLLLAGTWPAWIWSRRAPHEPNLERDDLSGASMTEFRLRVDCVYVPICFFGATAQPSLVAISSQPDMAPYQVGGSYDRPIPRRLAEEAGLPRGSFARRKLGISATLHGQPVQAFGPATLAAIRGYAAASGSGDVFRPRRRTGRLDRGLQRLARKLGAQGIAAWLQRRRQALTQFAAGDGNVVLRWAVAVVAPRYAAVARRVPPGSLAGQQGAEGLGHGRVDVGVEG